VIQQIQTQLAQKPSASDPTVGTLFGDPSMKSLLSSMRQMMYTADSTLPTGLASMGDLGVSTGAATGNLAPSQSAISGQLTLDASALATALTSNATGVRDVLTSWSIPFTKIVNDEAASGGAISSRITGESGQISDLGNRITSLNSLLTDKQNTLTQQFAALEGALSQSQSMSTWLTSQISSLPTA
jgi:flagellar hook-associated protein 2